MVFVLQHDILDHIVRDILVQVSVGGLVSELVVLADQVQGIWLCCGR